MVWLTHTMCSPWTPVGGPVSVGPGRPKVTASRVSRLGFPWERRNGGSEEDKMYSFFLSVHSQHVQHWLSCPRYRAEIGLFTGLAVSVFIALDNNIMYKSQFIREEAGRGFIALLDVLEESGTTFKHEAALCVLIPSTSNLWNISLFRVDVMNTGSVGYRRSLSAFHARATEQSDLGSMQVVCPEYNLPLLMS